MSDKKTPNENFASTSNVQGNNTNSAVCEEEAKNQMSYNELRRLFDQIHQLPGKKLVGIIHILRAREESFRDYDVDRGDEVDVNLLDLKPSTQNDLNAFVTSYLNETSTDTDKTSDSGDGSSSDSG